MRFPALGIAFASLLILAQAPPGGTVVHVPADEAVAILGQPVVAPDGKTIGHLVDVLVDDTGQPQAAVIDFGGFMGVGARKVAVHWSTLHFAPGDPKRPITLALTVDQIKAAPEYKNPARPAAVVVATPPTAGTASPSGASGSAGSPGALAPPSQQGAAGAPAPPSLPTSAGAATPPTATVSPSPVPSSGIAASSAPPSTSAPASPPAPPSPH